MAATRGSRGVFGGRVAWSWGAGGDGTAQRGGGCRSRLFFRNAVGAGRKRERKWEKSFSLNEVREVLVKAGLYRSTRIFGR